MNRRSTKWSAEWLLLAIALGQIGVSVVSWWAPISPLLTALYVICALITFAFAWDLTSNPQSVFTAVLYVTTAAAAGWVVFLLVSMTFPSLPIALLLAVFVGGPAGLAIVMLLIAKVMRARES